MSKHFDPRTLPYLAKSLDPRNPEEYGLALKSMGGFLEEVGKSFESNSFVPEGLPSWLAKATFSQPGSAVSGLNYYDLELGAKFLYPVLTPIRNETPRVSGKGGIQANWRAVTAINATGLRIGVSGGNRGGVQAVSTADYTAAYKGIGIETSVDFEAQYAGAGFDDVKAIGAKTGLEACMLGEEILLLGGDTSVALGTTPTPALSAGTAGALSNSTQSVIVAALSLDAVVNGSVVGGVQGSITRVNADGSSDTFGGGTAKLSAAASQVLSGGGSNQSVAATVAAVNGACGYAWFWGTAGSEVLGAITSINSLVITAAATGTQTALSLGANDNSTNNLVFDGLLYQALKPASNAYVKIMPTGVAGTGTVLTADGAGGIVEIDAFLKSLWDNYRLSPSTMWVSSQEMNNIGKKILAAGQTTGAMRINFDMDKGMVGGGIMVRSYLNKFSMDGGTELKIRLHPFMPSGTILFTTSQLPYPLSNVSNILQMRMRRDYYQIEWPTTSRKYQYGIYEDGVLQNFFPPSQGVLTNIGNG